MRFSFRIFLLLTLFGLAACNQSPQQAKLRIVDLEGNPHNVQMRTPELNMQALAAQGNLSEEKIQAQPRKSDKPTDQQVANNKYSNLDSSAKSSEAIKNTLQLPVDPQRNSVSQSVEISEADILTAGNSAKNKDQNIEYNLSKSDKGLPVTVAASTQEAAITQKQKGIFVQTGSFSVLQHAKNSLAKVEKFAAKPSDIKIEEAQSNNKTVYRVLIGPFSNKQKAAAMVSKLTKSGHQAIIVKNK